jgi:hypothetical protein
MLSGAVNIPAQRSVDPTSRYHRIICLVHLAGSGNQADPVRAEYAPTAVDEKRQGILAWGVQLTDDRSMAIVQFVAVNRHAFDAIFADARPEIRVFEIGKDSRAAIEAEMRKYKKDFDLSTLEVRAQ